MSYIINQFILPHKGVAHQVYSYGLHYSHSHIDVIIVIKFSEKVGLFFVKLSGFTFRSPEDGGNYEWHCPWKNKCMELTVYRLTQEFVSQSPEDLFSTLNDIKIRLAMLTTVYIVSINI